jgi:hypothetical protein
VALDQEPVMVEVQAKESKKKRNTKKKDKEKKNKGSKLQPATIKVVGRTTPILERKVVGLKNSSGEAGVTDSKPALMSPKLGDLQTDQPGSPARGRRDSDPRAFAASSRELHRLADDSDQRNKLRQSPTQSGGRNALAAPAEKEKTRGGSVIVGREKRTKSDASSDDELHSPTSSSPALLSPHDRPRSSGHQDKPPAASKLRESNAASPRGGKTSGSSAERGRSGTDSTPVLAVPSGSRSKEGSSSGHKRSHSSGSRESEPVVDLELDALKVRWNPHTT